MEKAHVIRLSINLLHKLWKKIVAATIYLYNRTSRASNNQMLPYEAFYIYVFEKEKVSGPCKPCLYHLRVYGCKAYILSKSKDNT